jgi:hypothetical protein
MQFDVQVWGLPTSVQIPKTSGQSAHRFLVYADREAGALTIDSLDDSQRWRFENSRATRSRGRTIEDLGTEGSWLGDAVLSGVFSELGGCPAAEVRDPADYGLLGVDKVTNTAWRRVACPWFPKDRVSAVFLGYTQSLPEPPQLTRVRFFLDGREVEALLSRIVYDERIPDAASSPYKTPPETYHIPPLRPGATTSEKMEHLKRTEHNERIGRD